MGNNAQTSAGGAGPTAPTVAASVWTEASRTLTSPLNITNDGNAINNTTIAGIAATNPTDTLYADSNLGAAGGTGRPWDPRDTIDNLIALNNATYAGLYRNLSLSGAQTATSSLGAYNIRLPPEQAGLSLGGQRVDDAVFHGGCVSGTGTVAGGLTYSAPLFVRARMTDTTTLEQSVWVDSILGGTINVSSLMRAYRCHGGGDAVGFLTTAAVVNLAGTGDFLGEDISGTWTINNPSSATVLAHDATVAISNMAGVGSVVYIYAADNVVVTITASCAAGTIRIYGNCKVDVDAAAASTIIHYRPDRITPYSANYAIDESAGAPAWQTVTTGIIRTPKDVQLRVDATNITVNLSVRIEVSFDNGANWFSLLAGAGFIPIAPGTTTMSTILNNTTIQGMYRVQLLTAGGGAGLVNVYVDLC